MGKSRSLGASKRWAVCEIVYLIEGSAHDGKRVTGQWGRLMVVSDHDDEWQADQAARHRAIVIDREEETDIRMVTVIPIWKAKR